MNGHVARRRGGWLHVARRGDDLGESAPSLASIHEGDSSRRLAVMPYLWTRPRRKRTYGVAIWLLYLAATAVTWGIKRESWIAYSEVPYFSAMNFPGNSGRRTSVFGLRSYLTIDRDMVDSTGKLVSAGDPLVRWNWNRREVIWSGAYTLAGAAGAYVLARVLIARGRLRGWCDECGYDLTGLESGRCPECGMNVGAARRQAGGDT